MLLVISVFLSLIFPSFFFFLKIRDMDNTFKILFIYSFSSIQIYLAYVPLPQDPMIWLKKID